MKKMTGKGARFLKTIHIVCIAIWELFQTQVDYREVYYCGLPDFVWDVFLETRMLLNIDLLELNGASAQESEAFQRNHAYIRYGLILEMAVFDFIISVSVFKPWKKSE